MFQSHDVWNYENKLYIAKCEWVRDRFSCISFDFFFLKNTHEPAAWTKTIADKPNDWRKKYNRLMRNPFFNYNYVILQFQLTTLSARVFVVIWVFLHTIQIRFLNFDNWHTQPAVKPQWKCRAKKTNHLHRRLGWPVIVVAVIVRIVHHPLTCDHFQKVDWYKN